MVVQVSYFMENFITVQNQIIKSNKWRQDIVDKIITDERFLTI